MNKSNQISLRKTTVTDLEMLFQFQLDKEAIHLAAFTPKDPTDKIAYMTKFKRLLEDPTITNRTIIVDKQIVGSIAKFIMEGHLTKIILFTSTNSSASNFKNIFRLGIFAP